MDTRTGSVCLVRAGLPSLPGSCYTKCLTEPGQPWELARDSRSPASNAINLVSLWALVSPYASLLAPTVAGKDMNEALDASPW